MYKIIRSKSKSNSYITIMGHKDAIRNQIDTYSELNNRTINVIDSEDDRYLLKINIEFIIGTTTDAPLLNIWLQNYFTTNSADFDEAKVEIYDCHHDTSESCENLINWDLGD